MVNSIRKTLKVAAVKSPFFGDRRKAFMDDLAIATGGTVINPEVGLKLSEAGLDLLGTVRRAVVTKDATTLVEGGGTKDDVRGAGSRSSSARSRTADSDWDREKLQERLAKLSGGVAVIKVGAATETALKERKHRIEDAVSATRAAVEEGIVPGGGSALVHAAAALEDGLGLTGDEATGVAIVRKALTAPLFWIAANGGLEGAVVVGKVAEQEWGHGFNAATLDLRRPDGRRRHRPGQGHPLAPWSTPRRSRGWCSPPRARSSTSPSRPRRPPRVGTATGTATSNTAKTAARTATSPQGGGGLRAWASAASTGAAGRAAACACGRG